MTPAPVVATTRGKVRGIDGGGWAAFLGLPYAAPPWDEHRLLAPRPHDRWDGARDCVAYGASAPRPAQGFTVIPEPVYEGDNCLNLNVFSPDVGRRAGGMPVLVWIHGGGFTNGCNASPWYHGRGFAADGIVTVAIGYRLGIEGFLPLEGAPANRAVLDWIAALTWVQDNIASFGGDPGNVTIGGQSAGGVACATLLAAPAARGLFRRAIAMSGAASRYQPPEYATKLAANIAERLGIAPTREAFARVAARDLVAAQEGRGETSTAQRRDPIERFGASAVGGLRFGPIVDGSVLPEIPLDVIRAGASADLELIVGSTAHENERAARLPSDVDEADALRGFKAMGMSDAQASAYRAAHSELTAKEVLARGLTDGMFRSPVVDLAAARGAAPTYVYEFQWESPTGLGSIHCLDIPYAFNVLDADRVSVVCGHDPPRSLADDVHGAWVRFIKDGDPGWPRYSPASRQVMAFNAPASGLVTDPHAAARDAFLEPAPVSLSR